MPRIPTYERQVIDSGNIGNVRFYNNVQPNDTQAQQQRRFGAGLQRAGLAIVDWANRPEAKKAKEQAKKANVLTSVAGAKKDALAFDNDLMRRRGKDATTMYDDAVKHYQQIGEQYLNSLDSEEEKNAFRQQWNAYEIRRLQDISNQEIKATGDYAQSSLKTTMASVIDQGKANWNNALDQQSNLVTTGKAARMSAEMAKLDENETEQLILNSRRAYVENIVSHVEDTAGVEEAKRVLDVFKSAGDDVDPDLEAKFNMRFRSHEKAKEIITDDSLVTKEDKLLKVQEIQDDEERRRVYDIVSRTEEIKERQIKRRRIEIVATEGPKIAADPKGYVIPKEYDTETQVELMEMRQKSMNKLNKDLSTVKAAWMTADGSGIENMSDKDFKMAIADLQAGDQAKVIEKYRSRIEDEEEVGGKKASEVRATGDIWMFDRLKQMAGENGLPLRMNLGVSARGKEKSEYTKSLQLTRDYNLAIDSLSDKEASDPAKVEQIISGLLLKYKGDAFVFEYADPVGHEDLATAIATKYNLPEDTAAKLMASIAYRESKVGLFMATSQDAADEYDIAGSPDPDTNMFIEETDTLVTIRDARGEIVTQIPRRRVVRPAAPPRVVADEEANTLTDLVAVRPL